MRRHGLAAASAMLAVLLGAPALAANPALTVSHPWVRFLTPQIPAAGYFTLHNNGTQPAVLTGASSPDCSQLMLHQSMDKNGMAEMKMVAAIVVPAHGSVTFHPGGYHLMCMSPTSAIAPGRHMPVNLQFKDGLSLSVDFAVYGAKGK
ncbi:MAG TPA: copper chaperone PCu(A)C [Acetobacteraceae bacterium]|nr:copper chaperone PCu(A)C [Acetobacteraceae bacterium]